MKAKKFFAVVTAFLLAFGLSTVAIAGPAVATPTTTTPTLSTATVTIDLTYISSCGPDTTNTWLVSNPSPATVIVSWHNEANTQSGSLSAAPGDNFFDTPRGTESMIISWGDDVTIAKGTVTTVSGEDQTCALLTLTPTPPPTPQCIPTNQVSYTYSYTTNSGTITVPDVEGSTHVLCDDFYVTATSWKFVKVGNTWPQMLDVTDKLGPISAPGSYDYAAAVTCGQGDIYASYTSQPEPTSVLNGPSDPFKEHFLHQMGFSGPNPTYFKQSHDCISVSPNVSSSLGACTFASDTSSKDLTFVFDNTTSSVPVIFTVPDAYEKGSSTKGITRTVPAGQKVSVVSTVTNAGATFAVDFSGVYTITIPSTSVTISAFPGCITKTPGDPSHTNEICTSRDIKVLGSITVGLETGLVYSIDGPGTANDVSPVTQATTSDLPAGDYVVTVEAKPGYVLTGASSWPLTITIKSANCGDLPIHPLVAPTASMVDITCKAQGSYTLDNVKGVLWSIGGQSVLPGTYKVKNSQTIIINAKPDSPDYGFEKGFTNPTIFTFVFTAPPITPECPQLRTDAFVTPKASSVNITCSAGGSYTLVNNPGVIWSINNATVLAGTYSVASAQTVVVNAKPNAPDWGFEAGVSNPSVFTFEFTSPDRIACDQLKTLAFTGGGSSNGMLFAGGLALVAVGGILIVSRRAVRRIK